MEEIVSNTSSIIFIGKLNSFNLIKKLYSRILIPEEVIQELFKYNKSENNLIKREIDSGFIKEINPETIKNIPVHAGEKAAISLCLEKNLPFLSDDKKARKYARSLKLQTIGVLGIILKNLQKKNLTKQEAKSLIRKLIENNYRMSIELYDRVMGLVG